MVELAVWQTSMTGVTHPSSASLAAIVQGSACSCLTKKQICFESMSVVNVAMPSSCQFAGQRYVNCWCSALPPLWNPDIILWICLEGLKEIYWSFSHVENGIQILLWISVANNCVWNCSGEYVYIIILKMSSRHASSYFIDSKTSRAMQITIFCNHAGSFTTLCWSALPCILTRLMWIWSASQRGQRLRCGRHITGCSNDRLWAASSSLHRYGWQNSSRTNALCLVPMFQRFYGRNEKPWAIHEFIIPVDNCRLLVVILTLYHISSAVPPSYDSFLTNWSP